MAERRLPIMDGPEFSAHDMFALLTERIKRARPPEASRFEFTDSAAGERIAYEIAQAGDDTQEAPRASVHVARPSLRLRRAITHTLGTDSFSPDWIDNINIAIFTPNTTGHAGVEMALSKDDSEELPAGHELSYSQCLRILEHGGGFEPASLPQRMGRRALRWLDSVVDAYGTARDGTLPYF